MPRPGLALLCGFSLAAVAALPPSPSVSRVFPLGGQRGTSVSVEMLGQYLSNVTGVEFDSADLTWELSGEASSGRLRGTVHIAPEAALGPHLVRVRTLDGDSPTVMFNVGQFRDLAEVEPNDTPASAHRLGRFPLEVQGILEGSADVDVYAFTASAGERLAFEVRSIEYGSAVEAKMILLDGQGSRVRFNDDRTDYLETPFIDHTFEQDGTYSLKIDQYRGPRGFNFGKNSSYILRASRLSTIAFVSPLGAGIGGTATVSLHGSGLDGVETVYLTQARSAEHARMTYPYTMPVRFGADPRTAAGIPRIPGQVFDRREDRVTARLEIPRSAHAGLWKIWAAGPAGVADGPLFELAAGREFREVDAASARLRDGPFVVNGVLGTRGERDVYSIRAKAGTPLHLMTLAAQLGGPHLDTVLTLRDARGELVAQNDDVVAGQGTLLGNPDSSLFHTPPEDGVLSLSVSDRTGRGGPSYQYRLKVAERPPSFQLFTTPENVSAPSGGEAEFKVHLVREEGFEGEVDIWLEGLPPGVEAPTGTFRADQLFVPNADGADMIIPEITFRLPVPAGLEPGRYPIRVLGAPEANRHGADSRIVEGRSTLVMGPLLDLWNFVRRPLPDVRVSVIEPAATRLATASGPVALQRGGRASLELAATGLPVESQLVLKGLPAGVTHEASRLDDRIMLSLQASGEAPLGSFSFSAEALVAGRWALTRAISLTIRERDRRYR